MANKSGLEDDGMGEEDGDEEHFCLLSLKGEEGLLSLLVPSSSSSSSSAEEEEEEECNLKEGFGEWLRRSKGRVLVLLLLLRVRVGV